MEGWAVMELGVIRLCGEGVWQKLGRPRGARRMLMLNLSESDGRLNNLPLVKLQGVME